MSAKLRDITEHVPSDKKHLLFVVWLNNFFFCPSSIGERRYRAIICVHATYFSRDTTQSIHKAHENLKPPATSPETTLVNRRINSRTPECGRQDLCLFILSGNINEAQSIQLLLKCPYGCSTPLAQSRNSSELVP